MNVSSIGQQFIEQYNVNTAVNAVQTAEEGQTLLAAAEPKADGNDLAAIFERSEQSTQQTEKAKGSTDHSAALTRRLVAAKYQGEVQSIISEAFKNLSECLQAAAGGDAKAMAAVKRLNKLIRRASRKIGDLNKEDLIRQQQKRAERAEQEEIASRLRAELKRKMLERAQRERKYLMEGRPQQGDQKPGLQAPSLAALEAKIQALAQSMAQLTTSAVTSHSTDCIPQGAVSDSPSQPPPASDPATE